MNELSSCQTGLSLYFRQSIISPFIPSSKLDTSRIYTGYTQKNGAVSKVNKKFISHLTRAQQYTVNSGKCPSFSCATSRSLALAYCGAAGPVSKMASQQEKAFCVLRFEVSRSVITVQREFRARFRKDEPCMVPLF